MKLTQIISILKARMGLVLAILAAVVVLVATLSLVLPKRYVATVALVVDTKATDPVTGMLLPLQMLPSHIATQLDVIKSHNVALKVVEKLRLAELPVLRQQFQDDTGGVGSLRDWLADQLLEQLEARPSRESSVIEIAYSSTDPRVAADMANAFAEAYVRTSIELKADPARRQTGWFEGQVSELRTALETGQQHLSDYQRDKQILSVDADRLDIENARLAELSSQLVAAQGMMYEAETRQSQLTRATASDRVGELPDVMSNALVQNLKAEIARAEAKLAETSGRYGKNHPQYLGAAAELSTLKEKLASELNTAKGSIGQTTQIAQRQVKELQGALDAQKARVLALTQQRDKLSVLTHDVESARGAYDAAMQRTAHVRLESELDQTDIAVLNPAIAPLRPVFPLLTLNLILACVLGTMLGVGTALVIEMTDRRVRSRADLIELVRIPVLAELRRIEKHRYIAAGVSP